MSGTLVSGLTALEQISQLLPIGTIAQSISNERTFLMRLKDSSAVALSTLYSREMKTSFQVQLGRLG